MSDSNEATTTITVELDDELMERVERHARRLDVSVETFIRAAISYELVGEETLDLVASFRGSLPEDVDEEEYRAYLREKHSEDT